MTNRKFYFGLFFGAILGILISGLLFYYKIVNKIKNRYIKSNKIEIGCADGTKMSQAYLAKMKILATAGISLEEESGIIQIPKADISALNSAADVNGNPAAFIAGVFGEHDGVNCLILYPADIDGRRLNNNNIAYETFPRLRSLQSMDIDTTIIATGITWNKYDYFFNCNSK